MSRRRRGPALSRWAWWSLACVYGLATVLPFGWLLLTSFKSGPEALLEPFGWPQSWNWENYTRAWELARLREDFGHSLSLTLLVVALTLAFGSTTAYAIARLPFQGSALVFRLYLAGLMIPIPLAVVPLFFWMKGLGLLGSPWGLALIYLATSLPFAVFFLVGYFSAIPGVQREAALLDGASEWKVFSRVMLPQAGAGLTTVGMITFLGVWNEYLVAFLLLSGPSAQGWRTLPLGLADLTLQSQFRSEFGLVFAGLVLVMLPTLLVYLAVQPALPQKARRGGGGLGW